MHPRAQENYVVRTSKRYVARRLQLDLGSFTLTKDDAWPKLARRLLVSEARSRGFLLGSRKHY